MYSVPVPTFASHFRSSSATNSGPLFERMFSGIPRYSITSASALITSYLPSFLATQIASQFDVYSSISVSMRSVLRPDQRSAALAHKHAFPPFVLFRIDEEVVDEGARG